MSLSIEPQIAKRVPLTATPSGIVLIEGTRIPLDLVVEAFTAGESAEEIALNYPLKLADIYAVLAYYLHHREEVDAYVAERRQAADALRVRIESRFDPRGIRERLLARQPAPQS